MGGGEGRGRGEGASLVTHATMQRKHTVKKKKKNKKYIYIYIYIYIYKPLCTRYRATPSIGQLIERVNFCAIPIGSMYFLLDASCCT